MTEAPPSSFAALRLDRLRKLQELRAERDKLIAQDPGGARQGLIEQYPTALDFAERFDMRTRRTPALELLARKLRETVDIKDGRLAVSIPPQEGKSTLLKWLIVWLLVQDPDRRIVFASFAQSLARRTGREVRNLLQTHPELALPLDQSHRDATDWGIAGKIGGLYSVGVGGALTGRSADCVSGDTPITTSRGVVSARDVFESAREHYILSLNHATGEREFRRVEAARRVARRPVVDVVTASGRVLRCTTDHRIHTPHGYRAAGVLRPGDQITVADLRGLREGDRQQEGADLSGLLRAGTSDHVPAGAVHAVRDRVSTDARGAREAAAPRATELLLLGEVCTASLVGVGRGASMRSLRTEDRAGQRSEVLHPRVPRGRPPAATCENMPGVFAGVHAEEQPDDVLLPELCKRGARCPDGRQRQLPLRGRHQLRRVVSADASTDHRAGRAAVSSMPDAPRATALHPSGQAGHSNPDASASHRPRSEAQRAGEPDPALRDVPRHPSQVDTDTVSVVRAVRGAGEPVYDLQVEGNRNFFAGEVLVHNCMIIDDPLRGQADADSDITRTNLHEWWESTSRTRLGTGAPALVVQCMTGDTPVLMSDGLEKPLRDVRAGDVVATYDDGKVTTATVRNWANQGPDSIYAIKMKSGRAVRANARHPFLSIEDGGLTWRRTDTLKPGIGILAVTGGSGAASHAPARAVKPKPGARACACLATGRSVGQTDTVPRPSIPSVSELGTSSIVMGSLLPSSMHCSNSSEDSALSVASHPRAEILEPTGMASSASTMTTRPAESVVCCAMTAISRSVMGSLQPCSAPPLTTYRPEADEVVEIVPCGVEDVFDLQIDRTENFIANGLISHNTRWHEDDLAGRLVGQGWPLVNIPALADGRTEDALHREPGEWLVSARGRTPSDWEATRKDVGERTFAALYQGRPAPLEGGIFQREWFNTHRLSQRPELDPVAIGVDPADTGKGDAAGILVAGVTPGGQIVFVADESGQLSQAQWARKACLAWIRHAASRIVQEHNLGMRTSIPDAWALLYRQATALDAAEDTRDGLARSWSATKALEEAGDTAAAKQKELHQLAATDLYREILDAGPTGPRVVSITPRQSKRVRAESVAGAFETGRAAMLGELKALEHEACFPAGTPVATTRGQVPIEQVTTDDYVTTRYGLRRVQWSGQTGVRNLLELRTTSGLKLQATPEHRVWIEGQGWTQLRFVTPGHIMRTCLGLAPGSTSLSRDVTTPLTRTATTRPMRFEVPNSAYSIETSGVRCTVTSPRAGTSTTWITTSPTTTPATSGPCPLPTTTPITRLIAAGLPGTPKRGAPVAVKTGPLDSPLPTFAAAVEQSSSRPASAPLTATPTVARPATPSAAASSRRPAIPRSSDEPSTTVVSVETVSGPPVPVYDLTVADDHEFFAGGLLVHNCTWVEGQKSPNRIDTLAMLTMHLESVRGVARVGRAKAGGGEGGAVIPINTAKGRAGSGAARGVTPMGMRRAMRGLPQSPHERDA